MKFKRLSVLFILALVLGTFFSSFASAETNDSRNLVALGDSITFGYHLPDQTGVQPSPSAFPNLIEEDFNVTNLGIPGLTSTALLTKVTTDPNFINSLKSANVVTLEIGSNDLLQAAGLTGTTTTLPDLSSQESQQRIALAVQQLGTNLTAIIQEIKKLTNAPIILYNIYNPFGANDSIYGSLHNDGEKIVNTVNSQVIVPIQLQSGSLLADAYSAFNGKQSDYIIPADVHPTQGGQIALAESAGKALKTLDQSGKDDDHSGDDNPGQNNTCNNNPGQGNTDNNNPGQGNTDNNNPGQDNPGQTVAPVQTTTTDLPTPTPTTAAIPVTTYSTSGTNYSLPNTATPYYNYLAAGFILILAGLSVFMIQRKKQSSKSI